MPEPRPPSSSVAWGLRGAGFALWVAWWWVVRLPDYGGFLPVPLMLVFAGATYLPVLLLGYGMATLAGRIRAGVVAAVLLAVICGAYVAFGYPEIAVGNWGALALVPAAVAGGRPREAAGPGRTAFAGAVAALGVLAVVAVDVHAARLDHRTPGKASRGWVAEIDSAAAFADRGPRSLEAHDASGLTLLHHAAEDGDLALAAALIAAGADVNAGVTSHIVNYKTRPLHLAARAGREEMVRRLIAAGAEIDAWSRWGTALQIAAAAGLPGIAEVLIGAGSDILHPGQGRATALHMAAASGSEETVALLLSAGAPVNAEDLLGRTPLHDAAAAGAAANIARLVAAGADVDAQDNIGQTPLMLAAREGKPEAVAALMRLGADPSIPDRKGRTPYDVARDTAAGRRRPFTEAELEALRRAILSD